MRVCRAIRCICHERLPDPHPRAARLQLAARVAAAVARGRAGRPAWGDCGPHVAHDPWLPRGYPRLDARGRLPAQSALPRERCAPEAAGRADRRGAGALPAAHLQARQPPSLPSDHIPHLQVLSQHHVCDHPGQVAAQKRALRRAPRAHLWQHPVPPPERLGDAARSFRCDDQAAVVAQLLCRPTEGDAGRQSHCVQHVRGTAVRPGPRDRGTRVADNKRDAQPQF
mmetsp:Transcript_10833/g.27858  ORF Transcript_10833/g.27858 Transcript_10833/m.27858 type:complete len:226 (-) Transcript_10833:1571-2248(-)